MTTNPRRFRPDTADRIRPTTEIRINGKVRFVTAVTLAPTTARPARRAFTVTDPADSMAQTGEVIYLDAGETIEQTWDPRIDRPTRDDLGATVDGMPTATRTAPSMYVVNVPRIDQGLRFTAHGETFEVVGEPITTGWNAVDVRVRQTSGQHNGNEFSAHLAAR